MSTLSGHQSNYLSCNNLTNLSELNRRHPSHHASVNQTNEFHNNRTTASTISNSRSYHNIYSSVYNSSNFKSTITGDDSTLDRPTNDFQMSLNDSVNFYI